MKNITIVSAETGQVQDLVIQPGTTAGDIRRQLGLSERQVITKARGQEPFGDDEEIYSVPQGAKLFVATPIEVGSRSIYSPIVRIAMEMQRDGLLSAGRPPVSFRSSASPIWVERDSRPYWKQRGWVCVGNEFHGFYRVSWGSYQGRAEVSPARRLDLFIRNPPKELSRHSHAACFIGREDGWHFIHQLGECGLSSAILGVERILNESRETVNRYER